jgi:hypothetical protein
MVIAECPVFFVIQVLAICSSSDHEQRKASIDWRYAPGEVMSHGTVMLGALLPVFSQRWALRDDASGLLLFLQFAGSALGTVFTGSHRIRSLTVGNGLLVLAT